MYWLLPLYVNDSSKSSNGSTGGLLLVTMLTTLNSRKLGVTHSGHLKITYCLPTETGGTQT